MLNTSKTRQANLNLESLEDRTALSVTSAFVDSRGVLQMRANNAPTQVDLRVSGSFVTVSDKSNGLFVAFRASTVREMKFVGGNNNDVVVNWTGVRLVADGGHGHDFLAGGWGNDSLEGGSGNDHIYGNEGHDAVMGGWGQDLVSGGGGDDWVDGGAGDGFRDTLIGGTGRDTFTYASRVGMEDIYQDVRTSERDRFWWV